MRTNRPEGIFQGNRTEPFFILLRHYADEQKEEAMKLTKEFLIFTVLQGVIGIIPIIISIFHLKTLPFAVAIAMIVAAVSIVNYFHLKTQLADLMMKEVDRLLQTDEYRYAAVNNEELFNKAAYTLKKTGGLIELRRYHWMCFVGIAIMVVLTILMQMQLINGG